MAHLAEAIGELTELVRGMHESRDGVQKVAERNCGVWKVHADYRTDIRRHVQASEDG